MIIWQICLIILMTVSYTHLSEALHYIYQLADALKFIHQHQMNHLDIKPGNVLLDNNNNATLIDFGRCV